MILFIFFGGFIGLVLFIILMATRTYVTCPKCNEKVYYTHNAVECEYCKTRLIIDRETKEVKEILS